MDELMTAFIDFYNTARELDQTPEEFVDNFEESYRILKADGGELPPKLLAVTLISNANLPEEELLQMRSNLAFESKLETNPEQWSARVLFSG